MTKYLSRSSIGASSIVFALFYACVICSPLLAQEETSSDNEPARLRRSESFFGIHFDFHANKGSQNIGATTTPEMVQAIIDAVHPDYIQVDSKGHPGLTSYPTNVGHPAPGVTKDSLKIWREVTRRNGVALYAHYSGVWDTEAATQRPEWAAVYSNGTRSTDITSVFGDYKDQLLIPQLLEIAQTYGLDGAWVDGECWATILDYSDKAKEEFKRSTGIDTIPVNATDENWNAWFSFHQEAFRNYLRQYVSAVKAKAPNFQIASNWGFTDHMAEPVSAGVDFISGDFSPDNSINAARYSTRLMARQGKPWDLMAWSFGSYQGQYGNWRQKPGFQISREAACVLSQGGGFQAYITQNPDGSVNLDKLQGMIETSKFCRARQELCQYSTSYPQIALFCPTLQHYKFAAESNQQLFPMIVWQRPILKSLLELNYPVDIYLDVTLAEAADEAKLLVFYRGGLWSKQLKDKVLDYVQNGGSVVLLGNESIAELKNELDDAQVVSSQNLNNDWFLSYYSLGKGKVATLSVSENVQEEFNSCSGDAFKKELDAIIREMYPEPMIRFAEIQPLDVSIRKTKDNRLTFHLVNVSGNHESAGILEQISPVNNIETSLRLEQKPQRIMLEPSGTKLDFTWDGSQAKFTIPSVPIYEIIVVE